MIIRRRGLLGNGFHGWDFGTTYRGLEGFHNFSGYVGFFQG